MDSALRLLAILALPIFLTLTLPIALQAWLANRMGDPTPKRDGRLSWDPVKHMDTLGTVVLPALSILAMGATSAFPLLIGWAKPLELDIRHYRSNQQLFIIESPLFLGPLLMAVLWTLLAKIILMLSIHEPFIQEVSIAGIKVGLSFFALALLPLPPLPLGNALLRNLPAKYLVHVLPYLQYSSLILMGLLIFGVLRPYISLMIELGYSIVNALTFWI
jgi:hypothetical protein